MHIASDAFPAKRHPVALATVVALHVVLVYAALTGLGVRVIPSMPHILEAHVLKDMPPPEPEQPQEFHKPAPFTPVIPTVPAPEVPVDQTQATISAYRDAVVPPIVDAMPSTVPGPATGTTPRAAAQAPVIDVSRCDRPEYPAAAARAEVSGTTHIAFAVDALGRVSSAQVLRSAGSSREHKLLDRAAVDALGKCPFRAGVDESGRPVGGNATVEYAWTLN